MSMLGYITIWVVYGFAISVYLCFSRVGYIPFSRFWNRAKKSFICIVKMCYLEVGWSDNWMR